MNSKGQSIGKKLEYLLQNNGLSIAELATFHALDYNYVSAIVNGVVPYSHSEDETYELFAKFFGVSMAYLIGQDRIKNIGVDLDKLSPNDKAAVLQFANYLAGKQ